MKVPPSIELDQAIIKRAAAVLLYLLDWRDGFGNDEAVRSLRDAKLDAALDTTAGPRPCVHQAVLKAFVTLAGRSVVWDSAGEVWRERREGDKP